MKNSRYMKLFVSKILDQCRNMGTGNGTPGDSVTLNAMKSLISNTLSKYMTPICHCFSKTTHKKMTRVKSTIENGVILSKAKDLIFSTSLKHLTGRSRKIRHFVTPLAFVLLSLSTFAQEEAEGISFAEANQKVVEDTETFFNYFADWAALSYANYTGGSDAEVQNLFNKVLKDYANSPIVQEIFQAIGDANQLDNESKSFFENTGVRTYFVGSLELDNVEEKFTPIRDLLNKSLNAKLNYAVTPNIIVTSRLSGNKDTGFSISFDVTSSDEIKDSKYDLDKTNSNNPFIANLNAAASGRMEAAKQIRSALQAGLSTLAADFDQNFLPGLLIRYNDDLYKTGELIEVAGAQQGTASLFVVTNNRETPGDPVTWTISPANDEAVINENEVRFPLNVGGEFTLTAKSGNEEVSITLKVVDVPTDINEILKQLLEDVLKPYAEEQLSKLETMAADSLNALADAISKNQELERFNYPIAEGNNELIPLLDEPYVLTAEEETFFNNDQDRKDAMESLRKQKKLTVDMEKVKNLISFVQGAVNNRDSLQIVLDDMLDKSGTVLGEITVSLLAGEGIEEAKAIITDYLNEHLSNLAGQEVSLSSIQPLAIVPTNQIPDAYDPAKNYYINPKIPYTDAQFAELEQEIKDYQAGFETPPFVVVNYSQDVSEENYIARAPRGTPVGLSNGQEHLVITLLNMPGSTLRAGVSSNSQASMNQEGKITLKKEEVEELLFFTFDLPIEDESLTFSGGDNMGSCDYFLYDELLITIPSSMKKIIDHYEVIDNELRWFRVKENQEGKEPGLYQIAGRPNYQGDKISSLNLTTNFKCFKCANEAIENGNTSIKKEEKLTLEGDFKTIYSGIPDNYAIKVEITDCKPGLSIVAGYDSNKIAICKTTTAEECGLDSKCNELNIVYEYDESKAKEIAKKIAEKQKNRSTIKTEKRSQGVFHHLAFVGENPGLDKKKIEILEEKLFLLNHYEKVYMTVVFVDLDNNEMYSQKTANQFADKIRTEAGLNEKAIVVAIPISHYESILWEHHDSCVGIGLSASEDYEKKIKLEVTESKGGLFESIMKLYAQIPKEVYLDYHYVTADGSLVTKQIHNENEITGLPFINNIELFISPNKATVDQKEAEISQLFQDYLYELESKSSATASIEALEKYKKAKAELSKLLPELLAKDLQTINDGDAMGKWNKVDDEIGKFRECYMRDTTIVKSFLAKKTGFIWIEQLAVSLNLSLISAEEHLYAYDAMKPIDDLVYGVIDIAGFIPIISDGADIVGLLYATARGDQTNKIMYTVGLLIPIAAGGGVIKAADNVYMAVAKKIDGKIGVILKKNGDEILEGEVQVMNIVAKSEDEANTILKNAEDFTTNKSGASKALDEINGVVNRVDDIIESVVDKKFAISTRDFPNISGNKDVGTLVAGSTKQVEEVSINGVAYKLPDGATISKYTFDGGVQKAVVDGLCFTKGTQIKTGMDSFKNIEEIAKGDEVISYDHKTNKTLMGKVTNVFRRTAKKLALVTIGATLFSATPDHPFYANNEYVEASKLNVGDSIYQMDGSYDLVKSVVLKDTTVTVYNFEVNGSHNYFIGDKGYLVHNECRLLDIESIIRKTDDKLIDTFQDFAENVFKNVPGDGTRAALNKKIVDLGDDQKIVDFVKDFAANSDAIKKIGGKVELVDAWKAVNHLPDAIKLEPSVLSKLNDIASRGRGIDLPKLETALKSDLGDVLGGATGDDLTKILNRLDADHVTGSHLDEITSRLGNAEYGIKQDLLENPDWFETFDDVLQEPGRYWDILAEGNISTGSPLARWGQGKWWKNLRDFADNFETGAARSRFQTDLNLDANRIVDQVTLEVNGTKIRIDYLGVDDAGKFHLGDAKFSTKDKNWSSSWLDAATPNQSTVYPLFESGNVNSIVVKVSDAKKADLLLDRLGLANNSTIDFTNSSLRVFGSDAGQTTVKSVVTIKN